MTARIPTVERDLMQDQRAYSLLEMKEFSEDERTFSGIASTPTPDRGDDVLESKGAIYKLPLPFYLQHGKGDIKDPVGWITEAKTTSDGIFVKGKIAKLDGPPKLKDDIDRAWALMKSGLVRGLSVGWRPVEAKHRGDSYGVHATKWEWFELSAVAIPMNAEATITSIKQLDQEQLRAATGENAEASVVVSEIAPDAESFRIAANEVARAFSVGLHNLSRRHGANLKKDLPVKTYKEQIAALEATRAAKAARMSEIQKGVTEESRTKDAAEREEFDTLAQDISGLESELKDLHDLEKMNISAAVVVNDGVTTQEKAVAFSGARVSINAKLEPGIKYARMAMCVARAKYMQKEGRFMAPEDIYRNEKRWMDTAPEVHLAMKAAVNGLDSTTAAAASEWAYARNIASEFVEYLRPLTLIGRIPGWRNVPFNIRVGVMDAGTTGYWVGQGLAINTSKPTSTNITLGITKVAGISVVTKELAMLSDPSAELLIRNDLAKALQQKMDTSLLDPTLGGVTNVQPASLLYGVTPRSASGTDFAAFKADWKSMTANFYAANIPLAGAVVIMKEELAEALSLMVTSLGVQQFPGMTPTGGTLLGRQVFTSQSVDTAGSPDYDNMLVLIQPGEVFLADDGQAIVEASDQVSIEMDGAPSSKSTATATGASSVSMWQTESVAIKAVRHVNWTKARSQAVQFIRTAAYL